MDNILIQLSLGIVPSTQEVENALYEVCDNVHASCNNQCPVYRLNGSKAPDTAKDFIVNRGCDCFKSGMKMRAFIIKHKSAAMKELRGQ